MSDSPPLPIAVAQGDSFERCAVDLSALVRTAATSARGYSGVLADAQQALGSSGGAYRVAVVAQTQDLLARRCRLFNTVADKGCDPGFLRSQGIFAAVLESSPRTAVVFPGHGSQYPNMLREVAPHFPVVETTLGQIDDAHEVLCGRPLRPSFWVDNAERCEESEEDIHCAVFAVNCALYNLVRAYGLEPELVMGQSTGDISALVASGVLSIEQGLEVVRERQAAISSLDLTDPGMMIALFCEAERAELLVRDCGFYAVVAARNSPALCLVSTSLQAVDVFFERCSAAGVKAIPVDISHAYHSRIIAGAAPRYRQVLATVDLKPPRYDIISSISGRSVLDLNREQLIDDLACQLTAPVQVESAIRHIYETGVRLFIECGPKGTMTSYVEATLGDQPHVAQATLRPRVGELEQTLRALACLFAQGVGQLQSQEPRPTEKTFSSTVSRDAAQDPPV